MYCTRTSCLLDPADIHSLCGLRGRAKEDLIVPTKATVIQCEYSKRLLQLPTCMWK